MIFIIACSNTDEDLESKSDDTIEDVDEEKGEDKQEDKKEDKKQDEVETDSEDNADLTLSLTKVDEDAGVILEENPVYQKLNDLVEENPQLGTPEDFSMFTVDFTEGAENNQEFLVFLGINRLDAPIKNINFDFTLGTTEGEYVYENLNVSIDEDQFGSFKPNETMPIMLDVTEEQYEVYQKITTENQVFEMNNFTFDTE